MQCSTSFLGSQAAEATVSANDMTAKQTSTHVNPAAFMGLPREKLHAGAAYAFQYAVPPPVGSAMPSDHVPSVRLPSIPVDLVQRIRSGIFVDASELLPELFEAAAYQGEGRESGRNLYSVNSPVDWAVSFTTYGSLICDMDPSRGHELFAYMGIVLQIARSLPGNEWLRYDRAFRQMAADNPHLPWSEVDYPLWASITHPSAGILGEVSQDLSESILRERSPTPPPFMPAAHTSPQVNSNSRWFTPRPLFEREEISQSTLQDWDYHPATMPAGGSSFEESARHSLGGQKVCQRWNETRCDDIGCHLVHVCGVCRSAQHRGRDCPERQLEDPKMLPPASSHPHSQNQEVCRNWNAEKCFFRDCKFLHACVHCKSGDHRGPDCSTIVEPTTSSATTETICRNWNAEKCFFRDCKYLHICTHCRSANHRGPECPTFVKPTKSPATTKDVCRNWNANRCFIRDCKYLHACVHCKSDDHRGPDCSTIVEPTTSSASTETICRNWNAEKCFFRDCRFLHVCIHCRSGDHRGPYCSTIEKAPGSAPPSNAPPKNAPQRNSRTPAGNAPPLSSPASNAPPRSSPAGNAPPRSSPASNAPPRSSPAGNAPPRSSPASNAPPRSVPASNAPPRSSPASNAPPQSSPAGNAPPRSSPAGNPPPWSSPAGIVASRNSAAGNAPERKDSTAGNATAQNFPAGNAPKGDAQAREGMTSGQAACRMWNNGWCFLKGCKYLHVCSRCRSSEHKAPTCPAQQEGNSGDDSREMRTNTAHNYRTVTVAANEPKEPAKDSDVCRKWNIKSCTGGPECKKLHVCLLCKTPDHSALSCPRVDEGKLGHTSSQAQPSPLICRNWNYKQCYVKDCQYQHVCMFCKSVSHPATLCAQLADADESEGSRDPNAQSCRDWNNSRCVFRDCRFRHACFRCRSAAHKGPNCPYTQ